MLPGTDITIRDSPAITIGVIVGLPWSGQTVELDNIGRQLYEDQTWEIVDARLRLVNTNVYRWEPNAFADNTLIVRNSDYSGSSINSGDAHYVIENSTLDFVLANERVTMVIRDSVIRGDVVARDDSHITLINTVVEGQLEPGEEKPRAMGNVFATGNGIVTLVNSTILGETFIEDNGEVIVEE